MSTQGPGAKCGGTGLLGHLVSPIVLVRGIELGFLLGPYTYAARLFELRVVAFSKGLHEYISCSHVGTLSSTITAVLPSWWSTT